VTTFQIVGDDFVLDGRPHRILAGTLHYFRVPRAYWADRIHKARLMGLNAIETYVPWNLHQPAPGTWVAEGRLDLGGFLDAVAEEGMQAIVRPGPYICAEFDGGGLPAWLFSEADPTDPDVASAGTATPVRSLDPRFIEPAGDYLRRVYDIVVPRQVDRGGPVILVQIENEYGAYGRDHDYLRALAELTRAAGVTVPLTTVDQPNGRMLEDGTLPDLLTTGSFGSRATERMAAVRRVQPTGPLMCSEFWDGWFDQWGDHHHTTSAADSAQSLAELLGLGASVTLYMFHGGTNLGLTNGANDKGLYRPITTSYDYDAPLDESGHPTEKYWAFREVLGRFTDLPDEVPGPRPPAPAPAGAFTSAISLSEVLGQLGSWRSARALPTMDALGQYRGFLACRATLPAPIAEGAPALLTVGEVRDRAIVESQGRRLGVLERMDHDTSVALPAGTRVLEILVEDMGRVDYGPRIGEHKGLVGPVLVGGREVTGWEVLAPDLSDLSPVREALEREALPGGTPLPRAGQAGPPDVGCASFLGATVRLARAEDLFLDTRGWGHGLVWMNGHLLGRYNRRGPSRTMYVPAPYLRAGDNELLVLETDTVPAMSWSFLESPDLGPVDW
jgi:beta-galactosidase